MVEIHIIVDKKINFLIFIGTSNGKVCDYIDRVNKYVIKCR